MTLITKDIFNFSDSLFKSLGYRKQPSIADSFDYNLPELEMFLEENLDYLFSSKNNLGFCRRLQKLLDVAGIHLYYTHSNIWSDAPFDISGTYYLDCDDHHTTDYTIHMYAKESSFKENWFKIKFELFSVICHETIHLLRAHKKQFIHNGYMVTDKDLNLSKRLSYERHYLSDIEEIHAYAMSICMENIFFGYSNTYDRYIQAFKNKKLKCRDNVLSILHYKIAEYFNDSPMLQ